MQKNFIHSKYSLYSSVIFLFFFTKQLLKFKNMLNQRVIEEFRLEGT